MKPDGVEIPFRFQIDLVTNFSPTPDPDLSGPDPRMLAGYVLRVCEGGSWPAPGSFYERLILASLVADSDNLARLGRAFPEVSLFVSWYKFQEGGRSVLVSIAEGSVSW